MVVILVNWLLSQNWPQEEIHLGDLRRTVKLTVPKKKRKKNPIQNTQFWTFGIYQVVKTGFERGFGRPKPCPDPIT